MVRIGGIAQAMMLPVIGIGVVYLRHRHLPKDICLAVGDGWAVGGYCADRVVDGLFGDRSDKENAMKIERRMPRDDEFQMPSFRLMAVRLWLPAAGVGLGWRWPRL